MESQHPEPLTGLSRELEDLLVKKTPPASKGLRFMNLIIDTVSIFLSIAVIFDPLLRTTYASTTGHPEDSHNILFLPEFILVWCVISCLYYSLMERFCGGRTIGKYCTNTKAVCHPAQEPLSFKKTFRRSLCRLVPFEAFSGFGVPWHDRWTRTMVVKTRSL